MARIERELYVNDINFLIENKIPHTIKYVGRSHKLSSPIGTYEYVNDVISKRGMGFIKKVGSHILSKKTHKKIPKIDYRGLGLVRINVDGVKEEVYRNVVEVDLNKAYWVAAYRLGIIDHDLYNKGLEKNGKDFVYNKVELLASIGTMAKRVKERKFNGKKYLKSKVLIDSSQTKHIWDAVSYEVDKCMRNCMLSLGEDFYFYWTDAVFFRRTEKNIKKVQDLILANGFESKIVDISYISKKGDDIMVWAKKNHSKAKKPIRDADGNFGRTFVYIHSKNSIIEEIKQELESHGEIDL